VASTPHHAALFGAPGTQAGRAAAQTPQAEPSVPATPFTPEAPHEIRFSQRITDFRGAISARGKGTGAGGKIETSGRSVYITGDVNASSERGKAGEWLIDPGNLVVRNLTGSETETDSLTDAQRVSSTLSGGTSVTVQTAGGDNGANDYSLTVQDNITKTSGGDATLTLKATGSIALNADITSAAGKLDLDIISDTNHLGGGNSLPLRYV